MRLKAEKPDPHERVYRLGHWWDMRLQKEEKSGFMANWVDSR